MRLAKIPMRYLLPGLIAFAVAVGIGGVLLVSGGETAPPDGGGATEGLTPEEQETAAALENAKDNAISMEGVAAKDWDSSLSYLVPLDLDSGAFLSREAAEEIAASSYPNVSLLDVAVGRLVEPLPGRDRPVWAFSLDPQDKDLGSPGPGETLTYYLVFIDAETGDYVTTWSASRCAPSGCLGGAAPADAPLSPPIRP